MDTEIKIPDEFRERTPLFRPQWMTMIRKMREHPHAPRWNAVCGDRLTEEDLRFVRRFEEALHRDRTPWNGDVPEKIRTWVWHLRSSSLWFRQAVSDEKNLDAFQTLRTMTRADLQSHLEILVPVDTDLSRLVVNPTSGTTGHPISAPNHPCSVGCYDPMIQFALQQYGVRERFGETKMAAIQICAQKTTMTYNTVHSSLDGAGFAKINLNPTEWREPESPGIYVASLEPVFYSGDPFSFQQAMQTGVDYRPKALLSTALALEDTPRKELEAFYGCRVVDFLSLNETGPLAYGCPDHPGQFHVLPHDIYIEVIDENGEPLPEGEPGEIAVTGGRNPYLPLLRYRTSDRARLSFQPCSCGDKMPRIYGLEARKAVVFVGTAGEVINPVDISRILRRYPILQHQFLQRTDRSCVLRLSLQRALSEIAKVQLSGEIENLFGPGIPLEIKFDLDPLLRENRKILPYIKE